MEATQTQKKREIRKEIYVNNIDMVRELMQINKNIEVLRSKPSYIKQFVEKGRL